jgi:single-strand DNA-binding protein
MASVNRVILIGNLGADPEVRQTPGGVPVANFSVATSEAWNDGQGHRQERTDWHRIVAWGKLAEVCAKFLVKGRQVFVEGRLQTNKWQDREGHARYTTEIQAQRVTFLGGGPGAKAAASTEAAGESDEHDYGPPPMTDAEGGAAKPAA